jgi:hypothetical protein
MKTTPKELVKFIDVAVETKVAVPTSIGWLQVEIDKNELISRVSRLPENIQINFVFVDGAVSIFPWRQGSLLNKKPDKLSTTQNHKLT